MPIIGSCRLSNGRYRLSANWPIIGRYRLTVDNRCTSINNGNQHIGQYCNATKANLCNHPIIPRKRLYLRNKFLSFSIIDKSWHGKGINHRKNVVPETNNKPTNRLRMIVIFIRNCKKLGYLQNKEQTYK